MAYEHIILFLWSIHKTFICYTWVTSGQQEYISPKFLPIQYYQGLYSFLLMPIYKVYTFPLHSSPDEKGETTLDAMIMDG